MQSTLDPLCFVFCVLCFVFFFFFVCVCMFWVVCQGIQKKNIFFLKQKKKKARNKLKKKVGHIEGCYYDSEDGEIQFAPPASDGFKWVTVGATFIVFGTLISVYACVSRRCVTCEFIESVLVAVFVLAPSTGCMFLFFFCQQRSAVSKTSKQANNHKNTKKKYKKSVHSKLDSVYLYMHFKLATLKHHNLIHGILKKNVTLKI